MDIGDAPLGHGGNLQAWSKSAPVYDGLYGGLPLHVVDRVTNALERILAFKAGKNTDCKEITLLDYGCGTGRYLPLLEKIAAEKGIHIRYLAYDAVPSMLVQTEQRIKKDDYQPLELRNNFPLNDPSHGQYARGHRGPACKKAFGQGSVTVQLLQPNVLRDAENPGPTANPDFLENDLLNEHIDMSLCMFGVLSYCQESKTRSAILKVLNNVTDGPILISSPTPQRDPLAYAEHNTWREEAANTASEARRVALEKRLRDANERGNTYIWFPGEKNPETGEIEWVENLYHFYDTQQFRQEMEQAGLQGIQIGCVNRDHEAVITQSLLTNLRDYKESVSLHPDKYDTEGMFLFCDALSSRAQAAGMEAAPVFYPPSKALITRLTDEIRNAERGTALAA